MSSSTIPLRPYQQAALDAVLEAKERGIRRQLVALPTGAGKTYLAAHLIKRLGWRTLMVVHRDELVNQSVRSFQQINPDLRIGVVKAERNELDADIIVASAQTLASQKRLDQLTEVLHRSDRPVLHIEDEAHHSAAPTRMATIAAVGAELLLGLTATPSRGDKQGLDAVYEEIVHHTGLLDLMRIGHLARVTGLRVPTKTDLNDVRSRGGDFAEGELAAAVNTEARNNLIVEAWKQHAGGRERTVAFCVDVAHAVALRDAFIAEGITAETVLGSTPADERAAILAAFHRGDLPVLTNCMVLTEGYDEPAIDCILMARPTQSGGLYQQMVGRGARNATGKVDCLVLDFADLSTKHNLASLPSLAGEEGAKAGERARLDGELLDLFGIAGRATELLTADEAAELAAKAQKVDLFNRLPLIWITGPDGLLTARITQNAWAILRPEGDGLIPIKMSTRSSGVPVLEQLFDRAVDLEVAQGIAQDYAEPSPLTDRNASWRTSEAPATYAQIQFARRLGIMVPEGATKPQVSALIDEALLREQLTNAGLLIPTAQGAQAATQPSVAASPTVKVLTGLYPIVELLQRARSAGLKFPKIRLATGEGWPIVLSLAGAGSKEPGSVSVTDGGPYGSGQWFGRISRNGQTFFQPSFSDEARDLLDKLARDPAGTAQVYGQRTGNCCFCAKALTEAGSIEVGYGPTCAEHFGLPHPQHAGGN